MRFAIIYKCVASGVIRLVIDFKMVLTACCEQPSVQLCFERWILYGNVSNVAGCRRVTGTQAELCGKLYRSTSCVEWQAFQADVLTTATPSADNQANSNTRTSGISHI